MRILVTGRDGQLARSLKALAVARPDLDVQFVARPSLDLAKPGSFAASIARLKPALVVNAAAYTAVDQAESEVGLARRINAEAVGEGAKAAADVGARFIQVSTDYVYGGNGSAPLSEAEPLVPLNVYGMTKLAGEEAVRAVCPEHLILRTAWVVSPFGRNFVRSMVMAARTRDLLKVVDDQHGSPTSALDLAGAIMEIARQWRTGSTAGVGETLHVAGTGETSWCGLAAHVMKECKTLALPSAEIFPIRTEDWPTPAPRPRWTVLDSSRLSETFGISMPDWRTSVSAIVEALAAD